MRELSLNILDIAENSFRAKAKRVKISIIAVKNDLVITISDDGMGMDKDFLATVSDPFVTTRSTRKVGMGIPLFKMEAEMSGGEFDIKSEKGKGTVVVATFKIDHIDRPPLGDIADTVVSIVGDLKGAELILYYRAFGCEYTFDTRDVKKELGDVSISSPEVLQFIRDLINDNIKTKNGGVSL